MDGVVENVRFPLPRGLGDRSMAEAGVALPGAASESSRS
jgi:hypothetical protein